MMYFLIFVIYLNIILKVQILNIFNIEIDGSENPLKALLYCCETGVRLANWMTGEARKTFASL